MRILKISGKCSDQFSAQLIENGASVGKHNGSVPENLRIGKGDYINFEVDAETGQIQNWKPLTAQTFNSKE